MKRIRVKVVTFSRADLERHLISTLGFPEDIVVTGIAKPINQEAWAITVQSGSFAEMYDLDMINTSTEARLFKT